MRLVIGELKIGDEHLYCSYLLQEDPKWLEDHAIHYVKQKLGQYIADKYVTITTENVLDESVHVAGPVGFNADKME